MLAAVLPSEKGERGQSQVLTLSLAHERPRRLVIGYGLLHGHARKGAADGFHQNRVAGFPRPTRRSSWPPAVKFAPCEPYAKSQVLQRFEADATFTHVELLAALLVFAGETG